MLYIKKYFFSFSADIFYEIYHFEFLSDKIRNYFFKKFVEYCEKLGDTNTEIHLLKRGKGDV